MKLKNQKDKITSVYKTELGYPIEAFKEMIHDARDSGYHTVSAKDIKMAGRKRNNLRNP